MNTLVINLPSRTDRLIQVTKELEGIDFTIVNGVEHTNPMLGIAQAHLNCIHIAKQREWDKVLILEDDVVLRKGALEYLNRALDKTPEDWNVLLGGLYECRKFTPTNEYWDKVGEFCGLHFYIVNANYYDKILEYDGVHHIDRWMNHKGTRGNCYVTKKFIATQRDGFSDNVKKRVDYSDKINRFPLL